MTTIDEVLEEINNAKDNLILMRTDLLGNETIFLLRKVGVVSHDNDYFKNMKGLSFDRDSDWDVYSPQFVGVPGAFVPQGYFEEKEGTTFNYKVGEQNIKNYLTEISHWNKGINFSEKWDKCLAAIDVYVNNRLL